jgi:tetratricopeptide (TPR) repeat protein
LGLAHTNLATLLAERGEADEAIAHFRRAIEIDPGPVRPYYQLAQLLRGQGKSSEAAKLDALGKKASRRFAEANNLRGTELAHQGKTSEAIAQFEQAIAVAPDYAQAHYNLADALALEGNIDDAMAHYRQALEIDPNFAAAKHRLEELSNR